MKPTNYKIVDAITAYLNTYEAIHGSRHISTLVLAKLFLELICTSREELLPELEDALKNEYIPQNNQFKVMQVIESVYRLPSDWVGAFVFKVVIGPNVKTLENKYRNALDSRIPITLFHTIFQKL
jgi:hypothetical protein